MGRAIFYCVQCSTRVSDSDIESGKGFRVGDHILCADCAPEDVKKISSKRMQAVSRPKTGETTLSPKVSLPAAPAEDQRPERNRMLVVGGGAFVVLLVMGALILLLTRGDRGGREKGDLSTGSGTESAPVAPPEAPDSREVAARGELSKAREFSDKGNRLFAIFDIFFA